MTERSGPPPPPPPDLTPAPTPAPAPAPAPDFVRPQADPRFDDGFFAKAPTAPSPSQRPWSEPSTSKPASSQNRGSLVALLLFALFAVLGYFGYQALFGKDDIVYRGANGEVDEIDPASVFVALPGYTYRPIPPQASQQARTALSSIPGLGGASVDINAQGVVQGSQIVGAVVALSIPPDILEQALEDEDPIESIEQGSGTEVEVVTLGDKPALKAQVGGAFMVVVFYENQAIIIAATDATTAESLATTILTALP